MKRFFIVAVALVASLNAMAWGTLGHCTIAEIAERNLTAKAKANIEAYTKGAPLASYAMWMDRVGNDPVLGRKGATKGWHASLVMRIARPRRRCAINIARAATRLLVCLIWRNYSRNARTNPIRWLCSR